MNISAPFIHRPVATTLLSVALLLAGALAYRLLPVAPLPQVEFPVIQVQAILPGASPETMASAVATPLERQFGRIAGVTEMTSQSLRGATTIVLQFDLNRSIDAAARDVQAAINAARSQLPTTLPNNPTYRKVNPADAPIMILALTSDTLPIGRVFDAADSILAQKLSQVEGVGQVFVGGGAKPAVRVQVDPGLLSQIGVGLKDVRASLGAVNANSPKGELANRTDAWAITANDQLFGAEQYRPVIVAYKNGAPIRLGDVAEVTDSVEDVRTAGLANGKRAVLIVLFRQPGTNIIETVDRVRGLLPLLQASVPPAIKLAVVLDRTTTIRASFRDIQITLVISIVLVVFVVFAPLAERARHPDPERGRAPVAARHVRRHVLPRLQPRQPLAHGADDLDGLRRRRRHRGPRERHALPRGGILEARRGAARLARDRLHRALDEHLAGGRVHPDPPDGRHRGPALPGVRRHPRAGHRRLADRLADRHPHDVRALAPDARRRGPPRLAVPARRARLRGPPARCTR